jgi:hypothetical protein
VHTAFVGGSEDSGARYNRHFVVKDPECRRLVRSPRVLLGSVLPAPSLLMQPELRGSADSSISPDVTIYCSIDPSRQALSI